MKWTGEHSVYLPLARYPNTKFYASHCIGDNVFEVMKGVMGEQFFHRSLICIC